MQVSPGPYQLPVRVAGRSVLPLRPGTCSSAGGLTPHATITRAVRLTITPSGGDGAHPGEGPRNPHARRRPGATVGGRTFVFAGVQAGGSRGNVAGNRWGGGKAAAPQGRPRPTAPPRCPGIARPALGDLGGR